MMVPPAIPYMDIEEDYTRCFGQLEITHMASRVNLPLTGVSIEASVSDLIAHVSIRQTFRNTYSNCMEATYTFPMAPGSAVSSFNLKVGNRIIKGVVQERQQARHNYQQAIQQGKRAAMLEQERDDVFTVQVGNLPPGEHVTVEIKYSERLSFFEDGKTELRLPMVVAPRYMPGAQTLNNPSGSGVEWDTTRVQDASRISPPRVPAFLDPGVDLKIGVTLYGFSTANMPAELSCTQHAVRAGVKNNSIRVELAYKGERLNRDFVLQWAASGPQLRSSLLTYTDSKGETYGVLSLLPPVRKGFIGTPRDVLFVLDRSGSMSGLKMVSAIRACALLLNTLGPRDRFAIESFDTTMEWMSGDWNDSRFIPANLAGIYKGEAYLRTIDARGGTELDSAMYYGLQAFASRSRAAGRAATMVLLTDGQVGNESEILRRIQYEIGDVRLFTVGIDSAVNTGLLKRLASLGGGTATFVQPGQQLEDALANVARDIGQPLVTDLRIEGMDLKPEQGSVAPERVADLFAGRASVTFVKLNSNRGRLKIRGRFANGKHFEERVQAQNVPLSSIAQLWAKARVVDLEDQFRYDTYRKDQIKHEIIHLAVKHSLLTRFTAFLAIDHAQIVNPGGWNNEVAQPVETPDSWSASLGSTMDIDRTFRKLGVREQAPMAEEHRMRSESGWGASGLADEVLATSTRLKSFSRITPSCNDQVSDAGSWAEDSEQMQTGQWKAFALEQPQCQAPSAPSPSHPPQAGGSTMPRQAAQAPSAPGAKHDIGKFGGESGRRTGGNKDIEAIRGPLEAFLRAFEQAYASIETMSGYPAAAVLEQLRQRLLQMLAPRQIGTEMPMLQRFLRADAINLILSLDNASYDRASLKNTWSIHRTMFDTAKAEAEALLQGRHSANASSAGTSGTGVFWEDSV
ncbi:MAG: VIT and VWA domain-containing protein [Candidatus Obscuribacterales bacterium]|nr:VIT and VWA domain-containing protein [Candidatus Obscuribacterales bacterium]